MIPQTNRSGRNLIPSDGWDESSEVGRNVSQTHTMTE
jgi:hypothetical protein